MQPFQEQSKSPHEELPLFILWMEFLPWFFNTTSKIPKRMRFSFTNRMDNLALDVLEKMIEATYTKNKGELLRSMDLSLEKMRILFRLCHLFRFISTEAYQHASQILLEVGRQLGGWRKQQAK
jgi:hypothetical protein